MNGTQFMLAIKQGQALGVEPVLGRTCRRCLGFRVYGARV